MIEVSKEEFKALKAYFPDLEKRTTKNGKIYIPTTARILQMIERKRKRGG